MEKCIKEVDTIKGKLNDEENTQMKEKYYKISDKYKNLKDFKTAMLDAKKVQKYFSFKEIDKKTKIIANKNVFLKDYMEKGKYYFRLY